MGVTGQTSYQMVILGMKSLAESPVRLRSDRELGEMPESVGGCLPGGVASDSCEARVVSKRRDECPAKSSAETGGEVAYSAMGWVICCRERGRGAPGRIGGDISVKGGGQESGLRGSGCLFKSIVSRETLGLSDWMVFWVGCWVESDEGEAEDMNCILNIPDVGRRVDSRCLLDADDDPALSPSDPESVSLVETLE